MRNKQLIFLFAIVFIFQSCGLFKRGENIDPANLKSLKQFTEVYALKNPKIDYTWMVLNGKVKVVSENQNVSLSAQLKSRNDSLVWLRLSKLLEVARAQANTQHFELLNRLERSYAKYSFAEIASYIDAKEGLSAFQNILYGNVPFNFSKAVFTKSDENYMLELSDSINQKAWLDKVNLKLIKYEISSAKLGTTATISFDKYEPTEKGLMPKYIKVEVSGGDLELVLLEFSKIEFFKKEKVEFDVPESYKKN